MSGSMFIRIGRVRGCAECQYYASERPFRTGYSPTRAHRTSALPAPRTPKACQGPVAFSVHATRLDESLHLPSPASVVCHVARRVVRGVVRTGMSGGTRRKEGWHGRPEGEAAKRRRVAPCTALHSAAASLAVAPVLVSLLPCLFHAPKSGWGSGACTCVQWSGRVGGAASTEGWGWGRLVLGACRACCAMLPYASPRVVSPESARCSASLR